MFKQNSKQNPEDEDEDNSISIIDNIELEDSKERVKEKERMALKKLFNSTNTEYMDVVGEWFEYKQARRETYKTDKSKQAFINKLQRLSGDNTAVAHEIITQSMANNWAGIFELKNDNNGHKKQQTNRPTSEELDIAVEIGLGIADYNDRRR